MPPIQLSSAPSIHLSSWDGAIRLRPPISETTYAYDDMGRVTEMRYPNDWVEYYTYDEMGRILKVEDTHPSEKPAKPQKHTYAYDANGNMTYEYRCSMSERYLDSQIE